MFASARFPTSLRTPAALLLVTGLAGQASADNKYWNLPGSSGDWNTAGSWFPVGAPQPGDAALIGSVVGVHNSFVYLDVNTTVARLDITDGMRLLTNGFRLTVNGDTTVSGRNTVDPVVYYSMIQIADAFVGIDLETDSLTLADQARVRLDAGLLRVNDTLTLAPGTVIEDHGTVTFTGSGTTFSNDGTIFADPEGLDFFQLSDGAFDLDGPSGDGRLMLNTVGASMSFTGDRLADPYSSRTLLSPEAHLHMDIAQGWAVDSLAELVVFSGGTGPVRITGTPLSFAGLFSFSGPARLDIECDIAFNASADVILSEDGHLRVLGDAVINDFSSFVLDQGADIDFLAPTTVHGGSFATFSTSTTDGTVDFVAATEWDGTVTMQGIVRQIGSATVTGASTINADVFDMDGSAQTAWNIQNSLVINAQRIDTSGNDYSNNLTINGGLFARLTVNLDDPDDAWSVSGTMNLSGSNSLFQTRVGGGSPMVVSGTINVPSGRVDIATPTTLLSNADVNLPTASSILRFNAPTLVFPTTTFAGPGSIQVGGAGDITLMSGLSTAGVGLINTGTLRVSNASGIASVDRFQNTGTWVVQIGGLAAGTQHDRLVVSGGPATLGGTLMIEHTDEDPAPGSFRPSPGQTFTILTAVGGVNGTFPTNVSSSDAAGFTYHWTVLHGSNDVTLRLDTVFPPPCPADFNHDGYVNSQDLFDFLTAFFALNPLADFNRSGTINSQDFFDFLSSFFNGCP